MRETLSVMYTDELNLLFKFKFFLCVTKSCFVYISNQQIHKLIKIAALIEKKYNNSIINACKADGASDAAIEAGAAAEIAASRKEAMYADLGSHYMFKPIAVEILCVFNSSASSF